jgi:hypothetical protein
MIRETNQPAAPARAPLQFLKIIKTSTVKMGERAKIHLMINTSVIGATKTEFGIKNTNKIGLDQFGATNGVCQIVF